MLPSHLRLSAARLLPALVALGACSCGAGSTEVTEGAGRVLRLALAPVGDPPADQHSVVETLLPVKGLAPWVLECSKPKPGVRPVPVERVADKAAQRNAPKRDAVWIDGELGEPKRVTIPGSFDPARFNRVVVHLIHYGSQAEATRVVLRSAGQVALAADWLAVPSTGAPPIAVPFDFPGTRRLSAPIDEVVLETRGIIRTSALFQVDLVHVPEHAFLPRASDPEPIAIGDEDRSGMGLASDLPLEASFEVPEPSELAFSYAASADLRIPGQALGLVVTLARETGEPVISERYEIDSRARVEPVWREARIDLAPLGGERARVRFALETPGGATAYAILGDVLVARRGKDAPTVLLVTSDTHRGDHLGQVSDRVKTPHLDALAARGVFFSDATSSTNVTNPSHVAVMTGISPRDTRILNNNTPLSLEARTLAECFRDAGYRTFASVSAFHLMHADSGLGQGFDRMNGPRVDERTGEETFARLSDMLERADGEPVFAWLHLFDAHAPYGPPRPFSERYWDGSDPFDPERPLRMPPIKEIPGFLSKLRDERYAYEQYRAEVDYVDFVMGRVLAVPRIAEGVVAFTADHGESFGEHGIWWDHADLFPETIHVPMILAWPGGPQGARVDRPVEQIDVAHTLLELAGVDAGSFPGRSLTWALERPDETRPRFQLSAHGNTASVQSGRWQLKLHLRNHHEWALEAGRTAHTVELYDLQADPGCLEDLARDPDHFETAKKLRRHLIDWLHGAAAHGLGRSRIQSSSAQESLQGLGYTGDEPENVPGALYEEDPADDWCRYFAE